MVLPQFDVFRDLLLNRRTAAWNLFYIIKKQTTTEKAFFISKSFNMTRKLAFASHPAHFDWHEKKPFDVIYRLYKRSILIGCYA